jgi:hypothetical protein
MNLKKAVQAIIDEQIKDYEEKNKKVLELIEEVQELDCLTSDKDLLPSAYQWRCFPVNINAIIKLVRLIRNALRERLPGMAPYDHMSKCITKLAEARDIFLFKSKGKGVKVDREKIKLLLTEAKYIYREKVSPHLRSIAKEALDVQIPGLEDLKVK